MFLAILRSIVELFVYYKAKPSIHCLGFSLEHQIKNKGKVKLIKILQVNGNNETSAKIEKYKFLTSYSCNYVH